MQVLEKYIYIIIIVIIASVLASGLIYIFSGDNTKSPVNTDSKITLTK